MRTTGTWSVGACRRLGAAGSAAAAAGGWAVGTLPARDPWGLWVPHGPVVTAAGYALAYGGLTLLVVSWWLYGRAGASVRHSLVTLVWWAAPFVLAPPLYSADVYSYIAQGAMVSEGHDVYGTGPSVLTPQGPAGTPRRVSAATGPRPPHRTARSSSCSRGAWPGPRAARSCPPCWACGSSPWVRWP